MQLTMINRIFCNHYRIVQKVDSNRMSDTYKAFDQKTDSFVAIKIFKKDKKKLSLTSWLHCKKEIDTISKIDHDNVLKVYDIGEYEDKYYIVTEFFQGLPFCRYLTQALKLDRAVEIVLLISSGLEACHREGIIHRYLNPYNLVIAQHGEENGLNGKQGIKITGFGCSSLLDPTTITEIEEIQDIFGYMSPEVSGILRTDIDSRSDIYSLGILFYRLISGELPYKGQDISTLIHQHIAQRPWPPSKINEALPEILDRIVLRLIAKDPQDRYQSLSSLIIDLKEYQNKKQQGNQTIDFVIARQDRLKNLAYSTSLVGRVGEFNQLRSFIRQTTRSHGNICLVYGEAGIGKTRLVEEALKSIHTVRGILIRGKCDQYESKTPFKVFAEVIRIYITNLERRSNKERDLLITKMRESVGELAGEVVKIASEITKLLGEPNELVELDAEKEKMRFLVTATNFFLSLGTSEIPVILFLDDLQWADEASIELLGRIAERVHSYPLLFIAGFRDTEIGDTHPLRKTINKLNAQKIPCHEIHLNRLTLNHTKEIVGEILLEDEGRISSLARDLDKRASGNPLFLIELLHSLIDGGIVSFQDNHYQYNALRSNEVTLPSNMVEVILRRIKGLSDQDSKILSYAAVLGRKIDFEILKKVSSLSPQVLLSTIKEAIKRQFVNGDIGGRGNFYFAHDRIQEAFYRKLPEDMRISLHGEIGNYIEEQNRDKHEPVLFKLAYHFGQAQIENKTLLYSSQAAKRALVSFAYGQAMELYTVVRGILEKEEKIESAEYIDTLENLGVAYYQAGKFGEALQTLKDCESLIPEEDKLRKAKVLSKIGDTLQKKGEMQKCEGVLVEALKILGIRLPQNIITVGLGIIGQLFLQGFHSLLPSIFILKECNNNPRIEVIAHLLYRLYYLYYFTNLYRSVYVLFRTLNIAERRLGLSYKLSQIYAITGMLWMQIGCPWWARRNSRLAEKVAEELNDKACIGLASAFYAWVEHPYRALESVKLAHKAVEVLKGVGEYWDLGHAGCCLLWGQQKAGKNFHELIEENKGQIAIMQSINALQNLGWVLGLKGQLLTYIGDERLKSEGISSLKESARLLEEVNDKPWFLCATGYMAYAHLRAGDYEEAIKLADYVAKQFWSYHNLTTWLLDIVGMCAQVYLYAIINQSHLLEAERKKYLKKARYFCRLAYLKGWMYPNYRGWGYCVNGTYLWLIGKKEKAIDTWEKGVAYLREHSQDTYRLASILLEEASFLIKDDLNNKKAHEYLVEAKEIFTELGAKLDLEKTVRLLESIAPKKETVDTRQALTLTRHLDSLLSVTKAIGSIFRLEELLEKIVDQAMKVTGAKRGFLLLYDEEDGTLQQKISKLIDKERLDKKTFSFVNSRISRSLVQRVEKNQRGLVEDQNSRTFPEIASELKEYGVKEALCVPLNVREKCLGVIYLDNCISGGIFGQNELELMNSFAVQASISIENAYLVNELIEHERSLQEMIERAPDAVIVYDKESKIINVNQQTCKALGYTRDELLSMTITDIQENYDPEQMVLIFNDLKRGPKTLSCFHKRKDGSKFPVEERLCTIEYRRRKAVLSLARDIKMRKKMEEELQKIQKLESLGVLAGGIAHDFNNLLTTIIGNLSLLELYAKSGNNIFEVLEETKRASQQTKFLTQQLLTFSRGGEPIKGTVSITKLLKDTVTLALSGSHVKCELSIPEDLWWVDIDEGQINQVINNLVLNAAQAMAGGGIISVWAENVIVRAHDNGVLKEGNYLKISIKDQGVGIPEEHLQRIFDPYFTTKQKGSGLGLAISYSIIKKHKGDITAESEVGVGTTFHVYIPATEKEILKLKKIEEQKVLRGKGKILFMDDQPGIRNMLGKMLSHIGYEVEYAQDGTEAIDLYKKEKETAGSFVAVILDLTVPGGMGGKETLQKLLQVDPEVRAIVSSGYSNNLIMSEYRKYGFRGVVSKPYEIKELSEVLHSVIIGEEG